MCCQAIYKMQLGRTCKVLRFHNGQVVAHSFTDSVLNFKEGHKAVTERGRVIEGADDGHPVLLF